MLAFIFVLCTGVMLRLSDREIEQRSPDEQAYTYYAKAMLKGLPQFQKSFEAYEQDERRWKYPPPTRVGYLALLAGTMKILDSESEEAGATLSCFFSILSLGLIVLFGFRFFNPWVTLAALYWFSLSPMELMISKRCWQDGVLTFFGGSLVYLTAELSRKPERKWVYFLFAMAASLAMLVKESGILLVGLCALWLLFQKIKEFHWIAMMVLASFVIYFLSLALALGGFGAVFQVFGHIKQAMASNDYAVRYQEGPWYFFLQGLWVLSPLALLAGLWGTARGALSKNPVWQAVAGTLLIFCVVAAIPHYFKNLRYLSAVYVPFYFMAGLGTWSVFSWLRQKLDGNIFRAVFAAALVLMLGVGVRDYRYFKTYYVYLQVPDLACRYLTEMMNSKNPQEFVTMQSRETKS